MTTSCDEVMGSRALAALTRLGHDGVQRPTPDQLDRGLDALHVRIATGRVRQRRMVRWSLAGVAMLMSVLVVLPIGLFCRRPASASAPPTLAYQVEGGSVLEGGYLRASGDAGVKLAFNEGSEFVFTPGTRGRLRSVDEEGANVAIESGTAHFEVTPSDNWRWRVEVGPFLVTVKGTVFSVAWAPGRERFELWLRRGRVEVSGPVSDGSLALRGGQRLVVDLARGETRIMEDLPELALDGGRDTAGRSAAPRASARASATTDEPLGPTPGSIGPAKAKRSKQDRRWAKELASGNWDRIIQDVERAGVGATLNDASSEELFALADTPSSSPSSLRRGRLPNGPKCCLVSAANFSRWGSR